MEMIVFSENWDTIVVKGRIKPVTVYEIMALRTDATQTMMDCIGLYELGMQAYFKQEWVKALSLFNPVFIT